MRCLDELNVRDKIEATSSYTASSPQLSYGPEYSYIDSLTGWRPKYDSTDEYLTVNIGEHMMISGIQTKGFHGEMFWVEAFQIRYSNDKIVWMTVKSALDDSKFDFYLIDSQKT